jgi:DMSO/TMAO reductase YedYZ molybdopterin-dependent catalytic subunit
MRSTDPHKRRFLRGGLAALGGLFVAGCDRLSNSEWFTRKVLGTGERLSSAVHHLLGARSAMAQEFTEADLSPEFRSNGTADPNSAAYRAHARNGFADWSLRVDGLVETAATFSLAEIQALPSRTQITRHDCVEGWSAIGKWTGTPLANVLARVKPMPQARFLVFHCADPMEDDGTQPYYESIDLDDAYHPQTILAYELNGKPLPIPNGAPVRLRVERQLGYKHAKYVERIELVASFEQIAGGKGGYWEDQGYQWYAGI